MIINHTDKDKVKQYLKEAVKATDRAKEEQANVTDILNTLKADHDIQPLIARKVITAMRKGNAPELREEMDDLELLLELV